MVGKEIDPVGIQPACHDLPIICTVPDERTNPESSHTAQKGKAAGPDDRPAEASALRVDTDTSVEMLYPLFMEIWEKNEGPAEWKKDTSSSFQIRVTSVGA